MDATLERKVVEEKIPRNETGSFRKSLVRQRHRLYTLVYLPEKVSSRVISAYQSQLDVIDEYEDAILKQLIAEVYSNLSPVFLEHEVASERGQKLKKNWEFRTDDKLKRVIKEWNLF